MQEHRLRAPREARHGPGARQGRKAALIENAKFWAAVHLTISLLYEVVKELVRQGEGVCRRMLDNPASPNHARKN